jgi:hypothetical protein
MQLGVVLDHTLEDLVDDRRTVLLDVSLERLDLLLGVLVDCSLGVFGLGLVLRENKIPRAISSRSCLRDFEDRSRHHIPRIRTR